MNQIALFNSSQFFSVIILSNTLLLAFIGIYLLTLKKRTKIENCAIGILVFIIFHAFYGLVTSLFFFEDLFLNVGSPFSLFYGLFLFAFVYSFSQNEKKLNKKISFHLIFPVFYTVSFIVILSDFHHFKKYIPPYLTTLYIINSLNFVIYAAYTYYVIKTKSVIKDYLNVYKNLLIELLLLLCCVAILFIGYTFGYNSLKSSDRIITYLIHFALFIAASIIIRHLIINNYKEKNIPQTEQNHALLKKDKEDSSMTETLSVSKYKKSKLTPSLLADYRELLEDIEDVFYLNPELSLESLAKKMGISKYNLTQVFSIGMKTNFNQFINKKRLIFAVELLNKEEEMSMENIAYACGFNSRTSFYRAFSKEYKTTPTNYKKENN